MKKDNLNSMIYLLSSPNKVKRFNQIFVLIKTSKDFRDIIENKLMNKEVVDEMEKIAFQTYVYLEKLWNENGRY